MKHKLIIRSAAYSTNSPMFFLDLLYIISLFSIVVNIRTQKMIDIFEFSRIVAFPIYQNVTAQPVSDPEIIRKNLTAQLTAPVRWTQTIQNMIADGVKDFTELGPGKVLQGLIQKIDKNATAISIDSL